MIIKIHYQSMSKIKLIHTNNYDMDVSSDRDLVLIC